MGLDVVLIDDDDLDHMWFKEKLAPSFDFDSLHQFRDAAEGLDHIANNEVDLAILDWTMPGVIPEELVRQVKEVRPDVSIVVLTGRLDLLPGSLIKAVVTKPPSIMRMRAILEGIS